MKVLKNFSLKEYLSYYLYIKIRLVAEFIWFTLPNYSKINKLKKIKNSKKNKKAFVFANGPSISKLDAYKIKSYQEKGFDVFAGNSYINTSFGEIVVPDFYVFSDNIHFGKKTTKLLYEKHKKEVTKVLGLKIPIFVPHRYCKGLDWPNTHVFNDSFDIFSNNVVDMTKPKGYVSLTLYKALSAACYMGYETIYICGFDNDYFKKLEVDQDNNIFVSDEHFYSKENLDSVKYKEEFHKSIGEVLISNTMNFTGLEKFKKNPIINLDKTGLVDSFSKKHDLDIYIN
jgi:hypothetical protein